MSSNLTCPTYSRHAECLHGHFLFRTARTQPKRGTMNQALTQQRVRIRFGKFGALRYVGHLDLATTWERTLRRADVPLEYTQGFNPRPRLQFAAALPLGLTSEWEYLDVWLTARLEDGFPQAWVARLQEKAPEGLRIYTLADVPIRAPSLPPQVTSAEYVLTPRDATLTPDDLRARAEALLARSHIERVRRKKSYDLRPLIYALHVDEEGRLVAWLSAGEKANARADELIDALGLTLAQVHAHRRRLYMDDEPRPVPDTLP